MPLIAAGMVAAVASPLVDWGSRHGAPRALGAALLMLLIVVLAVVVVIVVIGGITGQISDISGHLSDAKSTIEGWLKDLGVDAGTAQSATRMLAPRARARSRPSWRASRRASSRSRRSSSSCP